MAHPLVTSLMLVVLVSPLPSCARQQILEAPITSARAPVVMDCPLGVPHTHVELVETANGADVLLSTSEQRVTDLRMRVRDQTQMRGPGQNAGTGHLGQHGVGHEHGLRLWQLPPHEVGMADAPLGAVLHVTTAPERRDALVIQLRARIAQLSAPSCPW